MSIQFTIQNPSAPTGSIKLLEQEFSFQLPDDYALFLSKYNGGLPRNCNFAIPTIGQSSVAFFGLGTLEDYKNISFVQKQYSTRISDEFLCIGDDGGGNLILLDRKGSIWFWNHELEGEKQTIFLAHSFTDFLRSLSYEENEAW
ncbi:MAG TPA: SMI1/KNR4 family protein [Methylophilus sp.]|nr:SMI1/KNR4 family protein [Methylophilus sp.]